MSLTPAQLTTLKAAILAETDPAFVALREAGAHGAMIDFYNAPAVPAETAWRSTVTAQELDEGSNITAFDALGKQIYGIHQAYVTYGTDPAWKAVAQSAMDYIDANAPITTPYDGLETAQFQQQLGFIPYANVTNW